MADGEAQVNEEGIQEVRLLDGHMAGGGQNAKHPSRELPEDLQGGGLAEGQEDEVGSSEDSVLVSRTAAHLRWLCAGDPPH